MRNIEEIRTDAERYRTSPIFGTDFNKPLSAIIEVVRNEICKARNTINDIQHGYPGWKERVDHVEGLLTCGLVALHTSKEEIFQHEIRANDIELGPSLKFRSRGTGLDIVPCCFVCGTKEREPGANSYLNNISAYVDSKEDGEEILGWFKQGARLDYRERKPNYIQLKIGACNEHVKQLQHLHDITHYYGRIRQGNIEAAINCEALT